MIKNTAFILVIFIFCSCEKDETPIDPVERGNVIEGSVTLGAGYPTQVYYDLNSQISTGQNQITDWDLGFEGNVAGWKIVLNDARLMSAWASDYATIEAAIDSTGYGNRKTTETAALSISNPAMGDWRIEKPIYLIDLGYNTLGQSLGLVWIQIIENSENHYSLKFKIWGDSDIKTMNANKLAGSRFVFYKLGNDQPIVIPDDADWNIKFTKYSYQFIDPPMTYLVTGVILNPNGTVAAEMSDKPFLEITASDTANIYWSHQPDVIGYDWKYYDFGLGIYQIDSDRTWIIRTANGFYYKFRFTDFYDENGHVGTPQFELALI